MTARAVFPALFAVVLAARLCHWRVVWVEEAYPLAAALEMLRGKMLYRDFWFDKPPLFPLFYVLFGAQTGWVLRLAGSLVVMAACLFAYLLARRVWGEREGLTAAALLAFFLTFDIHASVMPAAPDLLMVAPHLAALYFCVRGKAFWAGVALGVALLLNPKAVFVGLACLVWQWRHAHNLLLGVAAAHAPVLAWLTVNGALHAHWEQVWRWGFSYGADTPHSHPWMEGIRRTANWAGFHAAVLAAAAWYWGRERTATSRRLALWTLISLVAIAAGLRFFPRYYFQLLTPLAVVASRGLWTMGRARALALLLLLVPLVRFGPRYALVAMDRPWADLALHDDSRAAARILASRGASSVLVWGYRPEVYVYSHAAAGTPFLDSQPLTGVIADRHLADSRPTTPDLARKHRTRLVAYEPAYIVDGLGPLNPQLAITRFADLGHWLRRYREIARTRYSVIYEMAEKRPK